MIVRERERTSALTDFSVLFQLMITYRIPMKVNSAFVLRHFPEEHVYYRCPRCQQLLEREHVAYCSRCGQCLEWHGNRTAKRVSPNKQHPKQRKI